MVHIACVKVPPRDRAFRVDAPAEGALERTSARARSVKRGDGTVASTQEAVVHIARINVGPRDRPRQVEDIEKKDQRALAGACTRAWSIERREGAVLSAQEAVVHIARVNVESRDRPRRVDVPGEGALTRACARARNVERGDSTVASAQEAVGYVACVNVVSRDRPRRVDAEGDGALERTSARARNVNVVMVPLLARRKPWYTLLASR